MKHLNMIATILVVVGGLNWGLYAFDMNLVNMLVGSYPTVEMIVYLLVAASAVHVGIMSSKMCCKK